MHMSEISKQGGLSGESGAGRRKSGDDVVRMPPKLSTAKKTPTKIDYYYRVSPFFSFICIAFLVLRRDNCEKHLNCFFFSCPLLLSFVADRKRKAGALCIPVRFYLLLLFATILYTLYTV
ncbi:hypothetical protein M440DRAFT_257180 [Trichoderma longibrachiatum ATCC 18648]|uniref:Uncharacterized protein n=1 Tax=Trichoderma longibrachiatum ATCC 18648 TaxID=983965 RepID=A0A2T4C9K3_TRILO|nr:hypothetical protein M440DRAFT_257180 [Trichoderma longibrachiatum ATCC 18648]